MIAGASNLAYGRVVATIAIAVDEDLTFSSLGWNYHLKEMLCDFGVGFGAGVAGGVAAKVIGKVGTKLTPHIRKATKAVADSKLGRSVSNVIDDFANCLKRTDYSKTAELVDEVGGLGESGTEYYYDGVKQASEYLQNQGVPRTYRKQILESFDVETIKLQTAGDNTYGLRFYGGNANAEGRYLFETFSPLTNRHNLALPYEWNSMTGLKQFQVRSGSTMIIGNAATQKGFGSQFIGGAKQWYINSLEDLIKCP